MMTPQSAARAWTLPQVWAYGGLGLPLAFAALPLYVHLTPFYSGMMSLTLLGSLLRVLRFFDAAIDPLLGALFDRFPHPRALIALALPLLGAGWVGVFTVQYTWPAPVWLAAMLGLATTGYSLATVAHNAWAARLSAHSEVRTRLFAAREAAGLVGVVLAAALPLALADTLAAGLARMGWVFVALLVLFGLVTLTLTPSVVAPARARAGVNWRALSRPFANPAFARFVPGYLVNGVAAALPATLVIFFIDDVLDLSVHSGVFLVLYFVAGAAGLPLWLWLAQRIGKLDAWLVAMALSVVSFVYAFWLGPGDAIGFGIVCVASGFALGADLALPPALVADMIAADPQPQPGAYYGLMSFFGKFTLALAAGLALPLLDVWGYMPGGGNILALSASYALLPCLLKIVALALLWRQRTPTGVLAC